MEIDLPNNTPPTPDALDAAPETLDADAPIHRGRPRKTTDVKIMPGKERTREVERRMEIVAQLSAMHMTMREIEETLERQGIVNPETGKCWGRATLFKDIERSMELVRQRTARSMGQKIDDMLSEVTEAKRRCWAEKDYTNLARFMDRESKILGADAPKRSEVTGADGSPLIPGLANASVETLMAAMKLILDKNSEEKT